MATKKKSGLKVLEESNITPSEIKFIYDNLKQVSIKGMEIFKKNEVKLNAVEVILALQEGGDLRNDVIEFLEKNKKSLKKMKKDIDMSTSIASKLEGIIL